MLEVGLRHPPGACQILDRPVFQQIDHRAAGLVIAGTARDRLLHEQLGRGIERAKDGVAQLVEAEITALAERPAQSAAQQHDLHEIVHVPRLQRGILSIVGEAQKLSRLRLDARILAEGAHGRGRDDRGCRRSAGLAECHQLSEVAGLAQIVRNPAAQAEHQGFGLEPPPERTFERHAAHRAIGPHEYALRQCAW